LEEIFRKYDEAQDYLDELWEGKDGEMDNTKK
jgi:hypothetical protein